MTVNIAAAMAVPVGLTTITRPRVAPVGTATVIVVDVAVNVVVDFVPNCTLVTVENPVPVMVMMAPTKPDVADNAVILGAAPSSPVMGETGVKTCIQLPTPIPVGGEGTVPGGHVRVC